MPTGTLSVELLVRSAYPGYITVNEFADITGYSTSYLYALVRRGEIEHITIDTGVRKGHMFLIKNDPAIIDLWKRRHNVYWYGMPNEEQQ